MSSISSVLTVLTIISVFMVTTPVGASDFVFGPFKDASSEQERVREAYDLILADSETREMVEQGVQLSVREVLDEDGIRTTKFQAHYNGIEIWGGEVFHHSGAQGVQLSNYLRSFDLETHPSLNTEEASAVVRAAEPGLELTEPPRLKILPKEDERAARLIYQATLRGDGYAGAEIWLDAHSGEIIAHGPLHRSLAPIWVFETNAACQQLMPNGEVRSLDLKKCTTSVANSQIQPKAHKSSRRAFTNAQRVLSYFQKRLNRNSLDGRGQPLISVVHAGARFANAFWLGGPYQIMAYGDGDGVETASFTRATDVAGHEMTHGMIEKTARFGPFGQAGALNEAFADFFGKLASGDGDWAIGRRLMIDPSRFPGIRNLAQPSSISTGIRDRQGKALPYPMHMSQKFPEQQKCDEKNDFCWVHINSTIPSHASYLVHYALGQTKAERIYYLALTRFLHQTATFKTAAAGVLQACKAMYDAGTCDIVRKAYERVGL